MKIQATLANNTGMNDKPIILAVRIQDADNMYAVRIEKETCDIYRNQGGSWTSLVSGACDPNDGDIATLFAKGDSLEFYINSTLLISTTDTAIPSGGTAGIGFGSVILSGDAISSVNELDDVYVYVGN